MIVYPAHVEHLRADGFTEDQILQVQQRCHAAEAASNFPRMGTGVRLNGAVRSCHQPLAEILDQLRPGIWVNKPIEGEHRAECPCCGKNAPIPPFPDERTRQLWSELESKLLSLGGERVVWRGAEPNLAHLVSKGRLVEQPMTFLAMPVTICHENAAVVWGKDVKDTKIVVGYGLYADGVWRQHSWATRSGTLLETNALPDKYFGIELSQEEALRFWFENYLLRHHPMPCHGWTRCAQQYPQVKALVDKVYKKQRQRKRKSLRALFHK